MRVVCKTGEVAENYSDYLTTGHWRDLRVDAYHKADGKCTVCKRYLTNNFICHHTSTGAYNRLGRERFNAEMPKLLQWFCRCKHYKDDVVAVCRKCHDGESETHHRIHNFYVPPWARRPDLGG